MRSKILCSLFRWQKSTDVFKTCFLWNITDWVQYSDLVLESLKKDGKSLGKSDKRMLDFLSWTSSNPRTSGFWKSISFLIRMAIVILVLQLSAHLTFLCHLLNWDWKTCLWKHQRLCQSSPRIPKRNNRFMQWNERQWT